MMECLQQLREQINEALLNGLDPNKGSLDVSLQYALKLPGKRVRPLLFLSLIDARQLDSRRYLDIASAIEYIHTYSLIHDDLPAMDNDDFRRGMPTVHKQFNEALAILTGDTLLTMAFEKIVHSGLQPEQMMRIIRILTQSIGSQGMAGGQVMDLEFSGNPDLIPRIHYLKTAQLIRGALLAAGVVVGMADKEMEILSELGSSIGTAFQLSDDLLDVEGDEVLVGKKLMKDQQNHRPNAAVFFGSDWVKNQIDILYIKTIEKLKQIELDYPPLLFLFEKMAYRDR